MKKIFSIIFTFAIVTGVSASEITGSISTDPNKLIKPAPVSTSTDITATNNSNASAPANGNARPLYLLTNKPAAAINKPAAVNVLGITRYPDNSLLRGSNKKIFIAAGSFKKEILSLPELQKFRDQPIFDVTADVLGQYSGLVRDWQLIREKGKARVYVVKNGKKILVPTVTELRRYFSGDKIETLSGNEMNLF